MEDHWKGVISCFPESFTATLSPEGCAIVAWGVIPLFPVRASQRIPRWSCRMSLRCCFCWPCCKGCGRFRDWRSWPFFLVSIRGMNRLAFRGRLFWWICNDHAWVSCIMPVSMSAVFKGRAARSIVRLLTISRDLKGAIPAVSAWLEVARFMLLALWSTHLNSLLFH